MKRKMTFKNFIKRLIDCLLKYGGLLVFFIILSSQLSDATNKIKGEKVTDNADTEAMQQQKTISGTVTDIKGEALAGVSVSVKGTNIGIITDANGNYKITNVSEKAILVFTYLGMKTVEMSIGNKSVLNVQLLEDTVALGEVQIVAVGYGTMKKKDLTGAVISVNPEKLKAEMPRTVQEILKGNVTGLEVGFSTNAKGTENMEIRGINSLKANTNPLLVVDGIIFQGTLSDINPFDIQKVDVLKDASSAAVYGTKAANGIILITTTHSGQSAGKPLINLSANLSSVIPGKMAHVYNAYEFIRWRQDVLRSMNWYSSPANEKLYLFDNPNELPSGVSMEMWMNGLTGDPIDIWLSRLGLRSIEINNYHAGKYVDWEKEVYRKGIFQDYNLSVTGKKEDISYYWSLNYTDNKGIVLGDFYKTIRSRLKFDFDITKWLTVGINTNFSERNESAVTANTWSIRNNSPWGSKYNDDGVTLRYSSIDDPLGSTNPLYTMAYTDQSNIIRSLITNMYGTIKLPYNISFQTTYSPFYSFRNLNIHYSSKHEEYRVQGGQASRENQTTFNWQLDNLLKWNQTVNKDHKFDVTLLYNAEKNQYWQNYMQGTGFSPSDVLGYHAMSAASLINISSQDTYSTGNSLMGRLYYSFKDRYMLTTSIRRDGYSAFGINNPYATLPAVALGWVFTDEKFFKNNLFYGKLRFSYGENGNREIGIYDALSDMTVGKNTYASQTGAAYEKVLLYIGTMANNNIKWEQTRSYNIGMDYDILNGLITGSLEVYDARTHDLLVNRVLPNVTGYNQVTTNLGQIQNRGFELSINAQLMKKNNFSWQTSFNFFLNRNKVIHLYGDMENIYDDKGNITGQKESDDITNKWFIGQALDRIWQPKVLGIWQLGEEAEARKYGQYPGDFKILDVNNDGKISQEDNVFQGYTLPRFRWNMRHDFTVLKNINMSFNLYSNWGQWGNYNDVAKDGGKNDRMNDVKYPYWTPETPYKQYYGRIGTYYAGSSFNVYRKKSFIRLENVSLSYKFNSKICNLLNVNNMTISASARNVYVWAPDWNYGDPEVDSGYPAPKQFSLGVNVTF